MSRFLLFLAAIALPSAVLSHEALPSAPSVATATVDNTSARGRIGKARVWNNDLFGDGQDRWRTGSLAISYIVGNAWSGQLPDQPGALVEYRLRSEIIAPANLVDPRIGTDRPYAGALSFGVFTHFERGGTDVALGIDFVTTGPQTRLGVFQTWAHKLVGSSVPGVLGNQIANGFYPTLSAEFGRELAIGPDGGQRMVLRPFVEGQAGVESFVRVGADLTFGALGKRDLRVRDVVTGQRIVAVRGDREGGLSFVLGFDAAYVLSSAYLPAARSYSLSDARIRVRSGVSYETENTRLFYGLTWLGKEFQAQTDSQVVGSLSLRIDF